MLHCSAAAKKINATGRIARIDAPGRDLTDARQPGVIFRVENYAKASERSQRRRAEIARVLAQDLGEDRVLGDPIEIKLLERDLGDPPEMFSQLLDAKPPGFGVRPRTTDELARAVRRLTTEKVPMTPRGLSSTGFGGAIPIAGGAVLDLSWLRGVLEVDVSRRTARVRAGTTFFFLQQALDAYGLALRARPTNGFGSIGGWASAGGLGLGSMAAGPISEHVDHLEIVLPAGRIERLDRNDTGFSDLFDAEGQLGVITELTVAVEPAPRHENVQATVHPTVADAVQAAAELFKRGNQPRTVILAGHTHEHPGLKGAPEGEILLVDHTAPPTRPRGRSLSFAHAHKLWNRRFFPMDTPHGPVFLASEVILPADRVAPFIDEARRLSRRYGAPLHSHSHAVSYHGTPSFLVLVMFPADPGRKLHHLMLTPLAAALTSHGVKLGGRAYGIGVWNTPFAEARFGKRRFEALRKRKQQVDPDGLLNPGKFFRLGSSARLLPELMHTNRFAPSLRLASTATPFVIPSAEHDATNFTTAERCISCGACVPVCPAVAATGAESVSARAKLALMRRLTAGRPASRDALLGCQRCLYCGQCGEVCARSLPLVDAWHELERMVRLRLDDEEALSSAIRTFTAQVDEQADRVLDVALP
jgi:glycolate dehydrogenase FAD-linked subunit